MDEKLITIDGKTKNISNWLKVYGLSSSALYRRIKMGMTIVEALTTPAKQNNNKGKLITIDGKTKNLTKWLAEYGLTEMAYYGRLKKGMTEVEALTSAKMNHEKKFYTVSLTFDEIAYLSRRCRKSVYNLINKGASIHQILMLPKYSKTASQQNRISDELSAFGIVY